MTRSISVRFILLATIAGLALLAGGFAIGRASEGDDSDSNGDTAANEEPAPTREAPEINTRACGNLAGPDAAEIVKLFPPVIVQDTDIEAEPADSPSRALLEWWQAYQFNDVAAVEALTSQATIESLGENNLTALVQLPGPGLQGIEILGVAGSGGTATVNTGLLNFQPEPGEPPPRQPTASVPESFTMEREGGEWKFASTEFLELKLNSLPD